MTKATNPVVEEAKSHVEDDNSITVVEGTRIRIKRVSASLVDSVTSRIQDPPVPKWHNPEKDRDEDNPLDPAYIRAVSDTDKRRGMAALDAVLMFGVELVDGLPTDTSWLSKLKLSQKIGLLEAGYLDAFDLGDPIDLEFLYKKHIMADAAMITILGKATGLSPEAISKAERSFPGNT